MTGTSSMEDDKTLKKSYQILIFEAPILFQYVPNSLHIKI